MQPFTSAQLAVLQGSRVERFHYELHRQVADSGGTYRWQVVDPNLQLVRECAVALNRYQKIKRTADFKIIDVGAVNFYGDAIRVFWHFRAAAVGSTEYQYTMGTFYMATPEAPLTKTGILRAVTCYDALVLLDQAHLTDWITFPALDNVVGTVINLISQSFPLAGISIPPSPVLFVTPKTFAPPMSLLDVCNNLLAWAGYTSLRADVNGSFTSTPYVKPSQRVMELMYYDTSAVPVLSPNASNLFIGDASVLVTDDFDVPNQIVGTVSEPGQGAPYPLLSQYDLPASHPLSAASRHRIISEPLSAGSLTQALLDDLVKARAEELLLNSHKLQFRTPLMPHDWADCLGLSYTRFPSSEPQGQSWIEESWTFPCVPGGVMQHTVALSALVT
jgi:hypothetical protein